MSAQGERPVPGVSPLRAWWFAVAGGVVAGWVEMLFVWQAGRVGIAVRMGPDLVWMIPAANAALFGCVGLGLAALLALRPGLRERPGLVVGVVSGLVTLEWMLLVESLHDLGPLLLAVGVGVQMARWSSTRVVRRSLRLAPALALGGLVGIASVGAWTGAHRSEAEALALSALPTAPDDAPNILLLILDTVRAAGTGLGGAPGDPTPHLDRAGSEGVVFSAALATAPWTLPSHASMFTGRWPGELSAGWTSPLDATTPTLAETLADHGWATAGFVGNLLNTAAHTGLDRGFVHYADYDRSLGQWVVSTSIGRALGYATWVRRLVALNEVINRRHAHEVSDDFLDWLDHEYSETSEHPWFAFVNLFDAHEPHVPDSVSRREWNHFVHRGGMVVGGNAWVAEKWTLDSDGRALHRHAYESRIRSVDDEVGRILAGLAARDELEKTLIVIASDHGEQLGERGLYEHNNSLYLPALHVPLVILEPSPREGAGTRVSQTVSLRDLAATILDLAGIDPVLPGSSLQPLWSGEPDAPRSPAVGYLRRGFVEQPATPISRGAEMHSILDGRWMYVHNGDDTDEIYDLLEDPFEGANLAGQDATADSALRALRGTIYPLVTGRPAPDDLPIRPATALTEPPR